MCPELHVWKGHLPVSPAPASPVVEVCGRARSWEQTRDCGFFQNPDCRAEAVSDSRNAWKAARTSGNTGRIRHQGALWL